ncbi:MAG: transketolase [Candidatus Yanofskybacteria bacterium]|nr:transketolase [Candidatus Yanofskybacteria bacterium]
MDSKELIKKAAWVRMEVLESTVSGGKGHIGGTYSCTDILVALYYGKILRFKLDNPGWEDRDRFILSKGHASLALFAIFKDMGIISPGLYETYGKNGGLGGQVDISLPGIETNTGSLGHSIGIAAGMALAAKMDSRDYYAYTMIGDAELFEGSVWEALMFGSQHKLNNLVVIIDRNRLSVMETIDDDNSVFMNFGRKLELFGWNYLELDGHNMDEILAVLGMVKLSDKPSIVMANTVKGKGVSFMENKANWHHGVPTKEQVEIARKELSSQWV